MTDEFDRDWIMSEEFDEACEHVLHRMHKGPPLNLAEAAELLNLPIDFVVECFADLANLARANSKTKALN